MGQLRHALLFTRDQATAQPGLRRGGGGGRLWGGGLWGGTYLGKGGLFWKATSVKKWQAKTRPAYYFFLHGKVSTLLDDCVFLFQFIEKVDPCLLGPIMRNVIFVSLWVLANRDVLLNKGKVEGNWYAWRDWKEIHDGKHSMRSSLHLGCLFKGLLYRDNCSYRQKK